MVNTLSKTLLLSVLAVAFLFMAGTVAEASYYTDRYDTNSYGRDTGGFLSFPNYPVNFEQTQNRNSLDVNQLTTQDTFNDKNLIFGENVRNRDLVANFQFNQDRLNLNQDGRSTQSGTNSNFDTGSFSYSVGDGTQPTYQRTLTGNFRGKRNDFTITETIFGGEKTNYNRNFGNRNTNTYSNNIGFNNNRFTNNINTNAGLTDNTLTRNTDLTQKDTNTFKNTYSLTKSDFGSGFRIVFN